MSNLNQLLKFNKRKKKKKKIKNKALNKCPYKRGVCLRVYTTNPKKPNSAKRKVAKIRILSTKKNIIAGIPGIGHRLMKHSNILIRGGRFNDVPGVNYKVVKGKEDLTWDEDIQRMKKRSKYGIKLQYMIEGYGLDLSYVKAVGWKPRTVETRSSRRNKRRKNNYV